MAVLGLLLIGAAVLAALWQKKEIVPSEKTTTVSPWVTLGLFALGLLCLTGGCSGSSEPSEAKSDTAIRTSR